MPRIVPLLIVAIAAINLAACGAVDALVNGMKHASAVEADLEKSTGIKPQVGFNWNNGQLVTVTVTFPRLYEAKPLRELAETVSRSVTAEFNQVPNTIVLGFAVGKGTAGTAAQLREPPANANHAEL